MVSTSNSQGKITLLELDSHSHKCEQVKILLDVDYWNCDVQILNLSLNCFLNFIMLTSLWLELDRWLSEKFIN